ncbi:MAG: hypothetical protein GKR77_03585 [Legionellales bacterium]|nr:hypothetical protein [Legionellales bacterium]
MSISSVLHIPLQPLPPSIRTIVQLIFIGAAVNVVSAQGWFAWQWVGLLVLGWGYRAWWRRHVTLTDQKAIHAITFTAESMRVHLTHQVQIQCQLRPPIKLLPWAVLISYQIPSHWHYKTMLLLQPCMSPEAWRQLRVRLLYSSI